VTFSHRGFAPSSAPPGGPDPAEYGSDLAALLDHLDARDVRIVAQSMGGWGALDVALAQPARIRALVLASTAGGTAWPVYPFPDPGTVARWFGQSEAAAGDLFSRGLHPAAGERMAHEQPAMHYLYRAIDALSADLDKMALRQRLMASLRRPPESLRTLAVPTLWLTGEEDPVLGMSYVQFAVEGLKHQQSQGLGDIKVPSGPRYAFYKLVDSVVTSTKDDKGHEKDLFDGIDTTLPGLTRRIADELNDVPWLLPTLKKISGRDLSDVNSLSDNAVELRDLVEKLKESDLDTRLKSPLEQALSEKQGQTEHALNLVLNLGFTAEVAPPPFPCRTLVERSADGRPCQRNPRLSRSRMRGSLTAQISRCAALRLRSQAANSWR